MISEFFDKHIREAHYIRPMIAVVCATLSLYLFMLAVNEYRSGQFIGSGVTATNTIVVSGTGDALAVPDIATFSVTIDEKDKDMTKARETSAKKSGAILSYLKEQGIADKDIQTTDYSFNPTYEWQQQTACPMNSYVPCPPSGKQVLTGYEVTETISVKVRDTSKAGDVLAGVNKLGADSVSGLSFVVDDDTVVQAQARDKAIADAKTKANILAQQLGVTIVRVVNFSDDGGNNPQPLMYATKVSSGGASDQTEVAPSPAIATGENKYTSNVSITYEIK